MLGLGLSLPEIGIRRVGSSATAVPALANLVIDFVAADMGTAGQANNTAISTWTDRVAGATYTAASNQPTYIAASSHLSNKPVARFAATHALNMGRPAALTSALAQSNTATGYTMAFVTWIDPAVSGSFKALWSYDDIPGNAKDNARTFVASSNAHGGRSQTRTRANLGTGFVVHFIHVSSTLNPNVSTGVASRNANGVQGILCSDSTKSYLLGSSVPGTAANGINGDVAEHKVWNRCLSAAERAQFVRYAAEQYNGGVIPWAGWNRFLICEGHSNTFGTTGGGNGGVNTSWVEQLVTAKSIPIDNYTNLGVPSSTINIFRASIALNYTGLQAQLGATYDIRQTNMEFYNQPEADAHSYLSYQDDLKAAGISKVMAHTALDNGSISGLTFTARAGFNTNVSAAAGTRFDILCDIALNLNIGVEGSCPNDPGPYGSYFAPDGKHLMQLGHTEYKNEVAAVACYDALVA